MKGERINTGEKEVNRALRTIRLLLGVLFFLVSVAVIGVFSGAKSTQGVKADFGSSFINVETAVTETSSEITVNNDFTMITFSADNSEFSGKVTFKGTGSISMIVFENPKSVVDYDYDKESNMFTSDFCVMLKNTASGISEIAYDLSKINAETVYLNVSFFDNNPRTVVVFNSDSEAESTIKSVIFTASNAEPTDIAKVSFSGTNEIKLSEVQFDGNIDVTVADGATLSIEDSFETEGTCPFVVNGTMNISGKDHVSIDSLTVGETGNFNFGGAKYRDKSINFDGYTEINGNATIRGDIGIKALKVTESGRLYARLSSTTYINDDYLENKGTVILRGDKDTNLHAHDDNVRIVNDGYFICGIPELEHGAINFENDSGTLLVVNKIGKLDFNITGNPAVYVYVDYYDEIIEDYNSGKIGDARKVEIPKAKQGLTYNGQYQTGLEGTFQYTVTNGVGKKVGTYVSTVSLKDEFFSWNGEEEDRKDKIIVWRIEECTHGGATEGICPNCGRPIGKGARVEFANVAFQENVILLLAVKTYNTESTPTLNVWTEADGEYEKTDKDYRTLTPETGKIIIDEESYFVFAITDLSAKTFTDNLAFTAEVDGVQSDVVTYSILEYAVNTKNKPYTSLALKSLIDSVLEYGATSQKYYGYKTDRLANEVYYRVNLTNCTFADGTTSAIIKEDEKITVYSPYEKACFSFNGNVDNVQYEYICKYIVNENMNITAYRSDDVKITVLPNDSKFGAVEIYQYGNPVEEIHAKVLGTEHVDNEDGTEIAFSGGYMVRAIPKTGYYFVGWENFTHESRITEEKTVYALFSDKRPTAVLDGKTLTFYYKHFEDEPQNAYDIPYTGVNPYDLRWNHTAVQNTVNKIVIDESFRDYPLLSTRKMFSGFGGVTVIEGIENLNMEKVTDAFAMFRGVGVGALDLSSFNTENIMNMGQMFAECYFLKELDLSGFDTGKVDDMYQMFANCSSLEKIDLSKWDTSRVENMSQIFMNCSSLIYIDLTSFTTVSLTNNFDMFVGAEKLKAIIVDDTFAYHYGWYTSNMFMDTSLEGIFTVGNEYSAQCARLSEIFDKIYYYSEEEPKETDAFWHYGESGLPEIWEIEEDEDE